jgi:hypothetical protein
MIYYTADTYVHWPTDNTSKLPYFRELPVGSIFSFSPHHYAERYIKVNKSGYKLLWDVENKTKTPRVYNGSQRQDGGDPLFWRASIISK